MWCTFSLIQFRLNKHKFNFVCYIFFNVAHMNWFDKIRLKDSLDRLLMLWKKNCKSFVTQQFVLVLDDYFQIVPVGDSRLYKDKIKYIVLKNDDKKKSPNDIGNECTIIVDPHHMNRITFLSILNTWQVPKDHAWQHDHVGTSPNLKSR